MFCFDTKFPSPASHNTVVFLLEMPYQDLKRVIPVSRHSDKWIDSFHCVYEIEFSVLSVKHIALVSLLWNAPFSLFVAYDRPEAGTANAWSFSIWHSYTPWTQNPRFED